MKVISFSLVNGSEYVGSVDDGPQFSIGTRVTYEGNKGLMNVRGKSSQKYDRAAYRATHGFWADFIHPTAMAEGALFHTLNTYDPAQFTFAFLQYAAHVPDGDFVVYFRELLQLPLAVEYFPDLRLDGGRIVREKNGVTIPLETSTSTAALRNYLNPTMTQVEDTEVIQAARLVHWVQNDPDHRRVQVNVGIAHFKKAMKQYSQWYGLDGREDFICAVIADIHHQGRASRPSPGIAKALKSAQPLDELLKIGEAKYKSRLVTLRREIESLLKDQTFGTRRYSAAQADFV
jgi:hypothetical protein